MRYIQTIWADLGSAQFAAESLPEGEKRTHLLEALSTARMWVKELEEELGAKEEIHGQRA